MLVAMNEERCRINASEANKKEKYFCPVCNEVLILKNGRINSADLGSSEINLFLTSFEIINASL